MSKVEEISDAIQDALGDKFGTTTPKMYCPNKLQNKVTIGILEKVEGGEAKRFSITIDDFWFDEQGNYKNIK